MSCSMARFHARRMLRSGARLLPAAVLAAGLGLAAVRADAARAQPFVPPSPPDQIVLQLQAEGWVETHTARVVAVVESALSGEEAGRVKERTPAALTELVPGAHWQVTGFDRNRDPTGLEHWRITAEARLTEAALGGIYDRARSISRPGRQVEIATVDFSPTLAEREETAAKLREEIYRRAAAEAKSARASLPDMEWRVHRVDFANAGGPRPMPRQGMEMHAMAAKAAPAPMADGGTTLSERMVVSATVVLSAPSPQPPRHEGPGRNGPDRNGPDRDGPHRRGPHAGPDGRPGMPQGEGAAMPPVPPGASPPLPSPGK